MMEDLSRSSFVGVVVLIPGGLQMITLAEPIDLDTLRIRHEFMSSPALSASVEAVAARYHIASRHARVALESLVVEGFLERTIEGQYVRVTPRAN
jgi:predicted transcriptional regulator of viral defense system